MSTVIFKWNPSFSSYTMRAFCVDMESANEGWFDYNWSVWEHDKVKKGDTFYWLKVGFGQNGIVGKGVTTSDPYRGEDWSRKGRETYYVDFRPEVLLTPDAFRLLSSDELMCRISGVDWKGGHSGVVLTDEQAQKLDELWNGYFNQLAPIFQKSREDNIYVKEY